MLTVARFVKAATAARIGSANIIRSVTSPLSFSRPTPAVHPQTGATVEAGVPRWVYKNLVGPAWNPTRDSAYDTIIATDEKWEGQTVYRSTKKTSNNYPVMLALFESIGPGETFTASIYMEAPPSLSPFYPSMLVFYKHGVGNLAREIYTKVGELERLVCTYTNNTSEPITGVYVYYYASGAAGDVTEFTCPQVEVGDRAAYYTPGQSPTALFVEEGAIPLIPSSYGLMTVDSDGNGVADGFSTAEYLASSVFAVDGQGQKITLAGATSAGSYSQVRIANLAVTANLPYTLSVDANLVRSGAETLDLRLQWFNADGGLVSEDVSPALTPISSRLSFTATSPPGAAKCLLKFTIFAKSVGATGWAQFKNAHFEQKPYATTMATVARAAEPTAVSTAGLSPTEGTWEQMVYIGEQQKSLSLGLEKTLFQIPRASGANTIGVWAYRTSGGNIALQTRDDTNAATTSNVMHISTLSIGWHRFFASWTPEEAVLAIDDLPKMTIANPKLPSAFWPQAFIGMFSGIATEYLNTAHSDIRTSSIARSDAERIATYQSGKPLTVDEHTTGLWKLNGTLEGYKASFVPLESGATRARFVA